MCVERENCSRRDVVGRWRGCGQSLQFRSVCGSVLSMKRVQRAQGVIDRVCEQKVLHEAEVVGKRGPRSWPNVQAPPAVSPQVSRINAFDDGTRLCSAILKMSVEFWPKTKTLANLKIYRTSRT